MGIYLQECGVLASTVGRHYGTGHMLAETVRRIRRAQGQSQEQVAERGGLSLRGLQKIEAGDITNPRLFTLRKLAVGLRCSVVELV